MLSDSPTSSPKPKPLFAPSMRAVFDVGVLDDSENEPVGMLPVPRSPIEIDCADTTDAANVTSMAGKTTALRVFCIGGSGRGSRFAKVGLLTRVHHLSIGVVRHCISQLFIRCERLELREERIHRRALFRTRVARGVPRQHEVR